MSIGFASSLRGDGKNKTKQKTRSKTGFRRQGAGKWLSQPRAHRAAIPGEGKHFPRSPPWAASCQARDLGPKCLLWLLPARELGLPATQP